MKLKKKTIALLSVPAFIMASTFGITQLAHAEGFYGDGERSGQHDRKHKKGKSVERLAKKLDLSDEQKAKVKALFEQQSASREAKRDERKALHEAIRKLDVNAANFDTALADVKARASIQAMARIDSLVFMKQKMGEILTAEQLAKFEEMKEKRGKHRG
ncbi:MAG: Spy/CpxP family protein refolding chaperone [Pseudomonadales bacterium]